MYNGVINVYKEPGFTSFDVVAKLKGILKQKKIGHTGTLDPDAEGVLVVCLGKATKLCDMLTDKDKCYQATMLLGVTTDTEDTSGTILTKSEIVSDEKEVEAAILSFVGTYEQIPPMYSAIKVNGKKLYELARNGQVIERQPRTVSIIEIQIQNINLPRVDFFVHCNKGTYIRSLCRDIGEKLGCGAVLEHLTRNCVISEETGKSFMLSDALSLEKIEQLVADGSFDKYILPIEDMYPNLDKLFVTDEGNKKLQNGNLLYGNDFIKNENLVYDKSYFKVKKEFLVYDAMKQFKAVYQYDENKKALKVCKMF